MAEQPDAAGAPPRVGNHAAVPVLSGDFEPGGVPRAPSGVTTTMLWPESLVRQPPAPPAPAVAAPFAGEWVTCPECGEGAFIDPAQRRAEDFCAKCDFPLFWARQAVVRMASDETGASLRRLPGTVGRAATASVACPHCGEPNSPTAVTCIRCGLPMVVVVPEPEPEPEPVYVAPEPLPEPEPEPGFPWGWVIFICALIIAITVVVAWIALL